MESDPQSSPRWRISDAGRAKRDESPIEDRTEQFLTLHAQNQHRLSAFVHVIVPNWQDAEEILQDTLLVLWRKFDEFDPQTSFFAWASQVARFEALNYRRRAARSRLVLSDHAFDVVAKSAAEQTLDLDLRREALERCLAKLSREDRELVQRRYADDGDVHAAAKAAQRTAGHVRRLLAKIRLRLLRCVESQLTERGG